MPRGGGWVCGEAVSTRRDGEVPCDFLDCAHDTTHTQLEMHFLLINVICTQWIVCGYVSVCLCNCYVVTYPEKRERERERVFVKISTVCVCIPR